MKLIDVFDGSLFEAQMIKNLLELAGIEAYLNNEIIGTRGMEWRATGGVKVIIAEQDYNRAYNVLKEYEDNLSK